MLKCKYHLVFKLDNFIKSFGLYSSVIYFFYITKCCIREVFYFYIYKYFFLKSKPLFDGHQYKSMQDLETELMVQMFWRVLVQYGHFDKTFTIWHIHIYRSFLNVQKSRFITIKTSILYKELKLLLCFKRDGR